MRKSNILPPDTFVRDNIKFIRMLGKKATNGCNSHECVMKVVNGVIDFTQ